MTKRSEPGQTDENGWRPTLPTPTSENGIVMLGKTELEQSDRAFEQRRDQDKVAKDVDVARSVEEADDGPAFVVGLGADSTPEAMDVATAESINRVDQTVVARPDMPELEANESERRAGSDAATSADAQSGEAQSGEAQSGEAQSGEAQSNDDQSNDDQSNTKDDDVLDDDDDESVSALKTSLEWLTVLVGAVVVALLFRAFLFQAFWIPSESMEGTLEVDDRVMVNRLSYRLHDVNRGDVVVFKKPSGLQSDVDDLIKRVMALEGETIEGRDNAVYVNGQRVAESYIDPNDYINNFGPQTVPAGHVFVMGDNRDDSTDSRVFGPVPIDSIVGRAFIIFWPFDRIEPL